MKSDGNNVRLRACEVRLLKGGKQRTKDQRSNATKSRFLSRAKDVGLVVSAVAITKISSERDQARAEATKYLTAFMNAEAECARARGEVAHERAAREETQAENTMLRRQLERVQAERKEEQQNARAELKARDREIMTLKAEKAAYKAMQAQPSASAPKKA
jgi:predicted RNase H-like nuclease (RuvC/YqgF family)